RSLNPLMSLDGTAMSIPTGLMPWEPGAKPRIAAVSSFGFSGTNAHVVLEEPPALPAAASSVEPSTFVLPISAKAASGVVRLSVEYANLLAGSVTPETVRDL